MRGWFAVLGFLLVAPAGASASDVLPHGIMAGVGNQYGVVGIGYTYRMSEVWAVGVGFGMDGLGLNGRVSPIEAYRPFYLQLEYSPVTASGNDNEYVWYGPAFAAGLERKTRALGLNFNFGLGQGSYTVLGTRLTQMAFTGALGVGINLE